MENAEENKVTNETLSGVSLSSQPSDELRKILKPRSENEALCDETKTVAVAGGDGPVVVTKVVERTEVTVVRVIQESKDGKIENQEMEEGFELSVAEKNQSIENVKEGVFGNSVGDDDEGNMVNSSGNGTSMDVDVKSSLAGENGSEVKPEFEGGDRHENAGGDQMDESKRDAKNEDERNVENKEEDDVEQDEMEEDHDFVVGDFVWGKIKSHPWWPGQIYDPSDASDNASALKRKGRLLVAYFGDGSFSWCSPSQLKPFIDCFQEMSGQSDSKKFVNSVRNALEEVSMLVEAELMCKCHMVDWIGNVGRVNSGIKEGVRVPKGNTVKVLIDKMNPVEILSILKGSATMESGTGIFELERTVVKTWLSSFYRYQGGYVLPEYHDPKCIEGLEDEEEKNGVGIGGDSDINGPSESAEYGDDKLYQRRKQKSVAELLGDPVGVEDEPKVKKAKTSKDGGSSGKSVAAVKRKPKPLVVSVTPESDHESGGVEDEMVSPRQRKKSKYLSPPYLSPILPGKLSGSGSFREPKTEPEKVPEMAAKQLEEETSRRSSGRKSRQRRRVREGSDSQDSKDEQKMIIDAAVNVSKVLHGLLTAALDPSCFAEKKSLREIIEFVLSFRSSVFEEGSGRKKDPTMTLVVEFPPEASLPTKTQLSGTYKRFGDLIKTEVQRDESRVLVVFGNSSDAEAALVMSMEKKPFGEVEYYLSEEALSREEDVADETSESDVAFVKRKLETMGEMVKKCQEDEMSSEVKARLEEGIKEVLEKVCKMREK